MTPSKIFLFFCFSFIAGIFLNSFFQVSLILMLTFLIIGIFLISFFWQYKKIVIIGFCVLFFVFGIFQHQKARFKVINAQLKNSENQGKIIEFTGIVISDPVKIDKALKMTILPEEKIEGKILVLSAKYPEYKYGDKLKIKGKLEAPGIVEGFNYQDYLVKDGIYSTMNWPKIEFIGSGFGNPLIKALFSLKNKLKESLNKQLSPPNSSLLEALFFGEEGGFSQEWKEKFNITGTRHIAAVSGMNITIISALILNFLLALGFWRNQAFLISIVLIIFYILMIGAAASALRAGVMAILFLLAQNSGRLASASRTIVFASIFMLFQNPLLLRFDAGFQLSFLATLGLIYLQPMFSNWLKKVPEFFQLKYTFCATMAAQIFTLPVLIYNFGRISIVSPTTNILIVPLLPLITVLGFGFSFLGIFWQDLAQIFSWPVWLLLTYLIKVVDLFSQISWASLAIKKAPWAIIPAFYLILGFFVWKIREKQKLRFLNY